MTKDTSRRLTIFEGPDGAGKTTAAKQFARDTDAKYIHLGPFPGITRSLGRLKAEAMLPAVLGHRDVVLDRSWLSEEPYGRAFRNGQDRLREPGRRSLERLALRCATVVVLCMPPWEVCRFNFVSRIEKEYLASEAQLHQVYKDYGSVYTALPIKRYDYTKKPVDFLSVEGLDGARTVPHSLGVDSAGSLTAPFLLVGEELEPHTYLDNLYRWPFGTFSDEGCGRWLTEHLETVEIKEDELLWINADQNPMALDLYAKERGRVYALGPVVSSMLSELDIAHVALPQPSHWKHYNRGQPYPLGPIKK